MLSVSALNNYIKSLVEEDVLLEAIVLSGEISNFTRHSSGHLYFSMKDEYSSISCLMWKDAARALKWEPKNGMETLVFGRVGVYEKQGRYQVYAEVMEDAGRGKLHAMFEALKLRLESKGYFDLSVKKAIPPEPKAVALVTSPTGAAIRDMLKVAENLDSTVKLIIAPCLVQGDGAGVSIAKAIDMLNRWGKADVMVVGRGGGSIEDLWAFNEEVVAEAIYKSHIPVISAVGHEVDFTIADFVADLRASTPSAAIAGLIKPKELQLKKLEELVGQLERLVQDRFAGYEFKLNSIINSRGFIKPVSLSYNYVARLKSLQKLANIQMAVQGERNQVKAGGLFARLEEASPVKVMRKGYSVAVANAKVLKSVENILPGQDVKVILGDGDFDAIVSKVNLGDGRNA